MSSLYGLTKEFKAFDELSSELEINEETGEIIDNSEQLKQLFDELECNFIDKLDSCQYIRKELEGKADILAAEIKRLQNRKKAFENRADRLKTLMCDSMVASGETKLKGKHNFSLGTRKVLQIDENITPDFFNQEYVRTTKEFDKKKLTDDLKNGAVVDGAKMVEKINFSIR
ncbi:siphovirus Gp157 family protein [Aliarcobacter butzleri]|uniref:siphovirus Gp157 family protein n=1 Tax=Aliarcobacter butzleri TaxID=28197 RepID=UPI00125EEFB1|nr:siphovirus Gp157 family protein [Aliarcobacter butzleri]